MCFKAQSNKVTWEKQITLWNGEHNGYILGRQIFTTARVQMRQLLAWLLLCKLPAFLSIMTFIVSRNGSKVFCDDIIFLSIRDGNNLLDFAQKLSVKSVQWFFFNQCFINIHGKIVLPTKWFFVRDPSEWSEWVTASVGVHQLISSININYIKITIKMWHKRANHVVRLWHITMKQII